MANIKREVVARAGSEASTSTLAYREEYARLMSDFGYSQASEFEGEDGDTKWWDYDPDEWTVEPEEEWEEAAAPPPLKTAPKSAPPVEATPRHLEEERQRRTALRRELERERLVRERERLVRERERLVRERACDAQMVPAPSPRARGLVAAARRDTDREPRGLPVPRIGFASNAEATPLSKRTSHDDRRAPEPFAGRRKDRRHTPRRHAAPGPPKNLRGLRALLCWGCAPRALSADEKRFTP